MQYQTRLYNFKPPLFLLGDNQEVTSLDLGGINTSMLTHYFYHEDQFTMEPGSLFISPFPRPRHTVDRHMLANSYVLDVK